MKQTTDLHLHACQAQVQLQHTLDAAQPNLHS
jgi:hypothetical protein